MTLELVELSENRVKQISETWESLAASGERDIFVTDYAQLFERILSSSGWGPLSGKSNVSVFYAVVESDTYLAVVELVQSRRGTETWIKMLDITMSPAIESELDSEENTNKRVKIFTSTLQAIMILAGSVCQARTFKIYGRTELLVTFLRGMHDTLSLLTRLGMLRGVLVSIEGRWLVFRAAEEGK